MILTTQCEEERYDAVQQKQQNKREEAINKSTVFLIYIKVNYTLNKGGYSISKDPLLFSLHSYKQDNGYLKSHMKMIYKF